MSDNDLIQKGQNDLIRRGDALAAVQEWTYCCDAEEAIATLPAVTVKANLQLVRDCHDAVNGEGPRAYDWSDKPHRLIYDLCREIERLATLELTPAPDAAAIRAAALKLVQLYDSAMDDLLGEDVHRTYPDSDEMAEIRRILGAPDACIPENS